METVPAISLYELKFTSLIALRRLCFLPPALRLYPSVLWRLLNRVQGPSLRRLPCPPPPVISLCHWDGSANTSEALRFDQTGEEHSGLPF